MAEPDRRRVIDLLGASAAASTSRAGELLERFALDPTKKGASTPRATARKVALVAALAADVELFILDEPTSGLDPLMEAEFRRVIEDERERGRTVLLSSHILAEVEALCDRVSIIRDGRNVESGSLGDLRHLRGRRSRRSSPGRRQGSMRRSSTTSTSRARGSTSTSTPTPSTRLATAHPARRAQHDQPAADPRGAVPPALRRQRRHGIGDGQRAMSSFVGTGALIRLGLRRDRLTLPIWIVVLGVMPASIANAYETFYPSAADRAGLTATIGRNPSVAVIYGPAFDLSTAGGFTAWRIGGFLAVFTALMAIFTVTRHSRAEEDSGRAELLASGAVGRSALLTAAIAIAAGASLLIGMLEALVLIAPTCRAPGPRARAGNGGDGSGVHSDHGGCQPARRLRSDGQRDRRGVLGLAFLSRAVGDSTTGRVAVVAVADRVGPADCGRSPTSAGGSWRSRRSPRPRRSLAYLLLPRRDSGRGCSLRVPARRGRSRPWPAPWRWRGACSGARGRMDGGHGHSARCSARSPMGSRPRR